jgi:hypothetical protein
MSLSLAAHVTLTDTEEGMVLLDERSGRYWQLNSTGADVLRRLRNGGTVDSAVAMLRDRYPDAAKQIADDVGKLVDALRAARVMTP